VYQFSFDILMLMTKHPEIQWLKKTSMSKHKPRVLTWAWSFWLCSLEGWELNTWELLKAGASNNAYRCLVDCAPLVSNLLVWTYSQSDGRDSSARRKVCWCFVSSFFWDTPLIKASYREPGQRERSKIRIQ
jgi:hypothetical protein